MLDKITESLKIIPSEQFGFEIAHSTVHAINKLVNDAFSALNNNLMLGTSLIDLEKAIDTVWLDGLLYKMIEKGFPFSILAITYHGSQNVHLAG